MKIKLKQPYWNGSKWIAAGREIEVTTSKAAEIEKQNKPERKKPQIIEEEE